MAYRRPFSEEALCPAISSKRQDAFPSLKNLQLKAYSFFELRIKKNLLFEERSDEFDSEGIGFFFPEARSRAERIRSYYTAPEEIVLRYFLRKSGVSATEDIQFIPHNYYIT